MINIAFDLDQCLIEILPMVRDLIWSKAFIDITDCKQYDIAEEYGLDRNFVIDCIHDVLRRYDEIPLVEGAQELLHKLYENGKRPIHIITDRSIEIARETCLLMERFKVPFTISFSNGYSKILFLNEWYLVEDRRKTALEVAKAEHSVILVEKSYNQPCEGAGIYQSNLLKN